MLRKYEKMTNLVKFDMSRARRQAACKQATEERRAGQTDLTLILWEESQYDDMQDLIKSAGYSK